MIVRGARVVTPGRDLGVADVRIENGVIAEVAAKVSPTEGERVIEADNLTLLPGFVDIHSHGRGGADFCDATDAAFDTIGRGKLADGVTGFLATGLTRPEEDLAEMCAAAERYKRRTGNGKRIPRAKRVAEGDALAGVGTGWCALPTILRRRKVVFSRLPDFPGATPSKFLATAMVSASFSSRASTTSARARRARRYRT